ncbi:MAG: methyltransferase domain-containing protein [Hydrotalea sp.]|nr:methyltransferase domain-containing protein [Hydrotalea sp.]
MKYLNLGCGSRYLENWENLDFISTNDNVKAYNLLNGLPYSDETFDVVYHSHVLEHFSYHSAEKFIKECYRVLKKGGVIRIVVPDLEQIVNMYQEQLRKVRSEPNEINKANYYWSVLEIYDQMIRNYSGGLMKDIWSKAQVINEDYIKERVGDEFINFRKGILSEVKQTYSKQKKQAFWVKYFSLTYYRNRLIVWLLKEPRLFELLELAKFRNSGEIHQWMYDNYSLGELLNESGFINVTQVNAFNSSIEDWEAHKWLDVENEKPRKPDSLFLEATK